MVGVPGVGERIVGVEGRGSRGWGSLAIKGAAQGPERDAPHQGLGVARSEATTQRNIYENNIFMNIKNFSIYLSVCQSSEVS